VAAAGVREAFVRGGVAFVVVAAIGQALAFVASAVIGGEASPWNVTKIGWIYVGAFHHVAIEFRLPNLEVAAPAGPGSTSLSIGVALLAVTAIAIWLLFRAGRGVAERVGGGRTARTLSGASVAPAYAFPSFVLALLVEVRTRLGIGGFASGELIASLSQWQSLAFPFAIAAVCGAAGGFSSALDRAGSTARGRLVGAAIAGGTRMFALGAVMALGGLVVAGAVQPDEPVALLTPTTARYWRTVVDRQATGLATLAHHVAVLPNEALWTLVPAMGACDVVRGSADAELLCYRRFPTSLGTTVQPVTGEGDVRVPVGDATFEPAPAGYLLFALVPAVATFLGGTRAARTSAETRRRAVLAGVAAGVVFAVLVAASSLLSTVVIGYGAAFGTDATAGWIVVGPDVVGGTLAALVWGCIGGAIGAVTVSRPEGERSG
jgi:hypothetical protein